jgi:hypothetical protein
MQAHMERLSLLPDVVKANLGLQQLETVRQKVGKVAKQQV